ncbi:PepSY-like domain-containing protein [Mucilaginibacter sp.]|uniref:PepSY-like domain-containing protein n=1 Tax=Mucilaginibacter sp. TaxID=1882438 RepID=UPI0032630392
MKSKFLYYSLMLLGSIGAFSSCTKDAANTATDTTTTATTSALATAVASTGSIAIASISLSGTTDSLYLVGCMSRHGKKDTVAFSALPAAVGTYLTANYAGYTFTKAFAVKDSLSTITNYIVAIKYNGNIVGLKFAADGTFVSVLEQRIGDDLKHGRRFHEGGPFGDRNGHPRDTIALSAIPTAVSTYFTANYAADTLLHALVTHDSTYVLISKNNGLFATTITPAGSLVKRVQIDNHRGKVASVTELPAPATAYLTATYAGYVFNKAFSISKAGVIQSYDVFITVNNTKYVVVFNAAGTFVAAKAIR